MVTTRLVFSAFGVPSQVRAEAVIRAMQAAFVNATIAAIPSLILYINGEIMYMHVLMRNKKV